MATPTDKPFGSSKNPHLSVQHKHTSIRRSSSTRRTATEKDDHAQIVRGAKEQITTLVHPKELASSKLPPALSAIATTERNQEQHFFFKKSVTGSGRYPAPKDIEHEAGLGSFQSTSRPINQGVLELLHSWKQDVSDNAVTAVISDIGKPQVGGQGTEGRLIWLHSQEPIQSIDLLKETFDTKLASFVQPFVHVTVRSVLERLRLLRERKFKLGKYLTPGLIRYTADSALTGYKDNPCLFLNFPFLALGRFDTKPAENIKNSHPVRSLLQWRYRLESTKKRDHLQSINSLKDEDILDVIGLGENGESPISSKEERLIHVPQLWSMSVCGDILVTSGPFSQSELCGSYLEIRDAWSRQSSQQHRPHVVRILCEVEGTSKTTFLFSADRCESYYALLDKKSKVETSLGIKPKEGRKATSYDLLYQASNGEDDGMSEVVTSSNWSRILRLHSTDCIDLLMRALVPVVETTISDDSGEESSTSHSSSNPADVLAFLNDPPRSASKATVSTRDNSPQPGTNLQFRPFMTWVFLTEYTSGEENSEEYKVNLWLTKIFRTLHRKHGKIIDKSLQIGPGLRQFSNSSQKVFPPVRGSTFDTVLKSCQTEDRGSNAADPSVPKGCYEVATRSRDVLALWAVNRTHTVHSDPQLVNSDTSDHPLMQLYWGLVYRITSKACEGCIKADALYTLCDALRDMKHAAEEIHYGVMKMAPNNGQTQSGELTYSDRAFVQPPLMDAFEQLVNMLFKIVKKLNESNKGEPCKEADITKITQKKLEKYNQSLGYARENLISDTEDARDQEYLGPLVTPEAITILLLDRLSKGYCGKKSVNFIQLYEKIVERVASKIERHYSRFLLIEINTVQEEIEIMLEILKEQIQFLDSYAFHLDPQNITNHTTRRETGFEFERGAIDRIRKDVKERIEDCNELLKRVKSLAQKNLRLVESYQDESSRKLMVFTVVNIIFLPLSFVAGFLGMNVKGVVDTDHTAKHFWAIAAPLTGGVVILSTIMLGWEWILEAVLHIRSKKGV